jgi:hypothetical protein
MKELAVQDRSSQGPVAFIEQHVNWKKAMDRIKKLLE